MGWPYEAPSGGFEDESTDPDAGRFTDDVTSPGFDGYSHDPASAGAYQDADEYDYDEDDDLEGDDFDEGELGGQAGWEPGAGQAGGRGPM